MVTPIVRVGPVQPVTLKRHLEETTGVRKAILVVDGDYGTRAFYSRVIGHDPELREFEVLTVRNIAEALEVYRGNQRRIVAVTTGRVMFDLDEGDRIVRGIRAIETSGRGVGIAMISGELPEEAERQSIGADEYLEKGGQMHIDKYAGTVKRMIALTKQRRPDLNLT
ncbi:MAG: hypothetical protein V1703_01055 [Candidatus Altiarchaeota archaeon]